MNKNIPTIKNTHSVKVVLIGSYNGHDSLGDECLLESVVSQFNRIYDTPEIVLHAHAPDTPVLKRLSQDFVFHSNQGLQTLFWWWRNKWRHLRSPIAVFGTVAALTFPFYLLLSLLQAGSRGAVALRQIAHADIVFVFGGTNFSQQWFWLNAPYYFVTSLLTRLFGGKTFFATQQYGPMTPFQTWLMKAWLRLLVSDFRARNPDCLKLLGEPDTRRETWDEVFSNRLLYPLATAEGEQAGTHILLNLRGGDLIGRGGYTRADLAGFIDLLRKVHAATGLPYRFFAVSGTEFCEDEAAVALLQQELGGAFEANLGRIAHGQKLAELGRTAAACISMSFHGCILSGMAGIPFVPVTDGRYYDHKYVGFDKYGDGQRLPLIQLRECGPADADQVLHYLAHFDRAAALRQRVRAAECLEAYYDRIAATVRP